MVKHIFRNALIGGLILLLLNLLFWNTLPHSGVMHKFENEALVAEALQKNGLENGMYILPNPYISKSYDDMEESAQLLKRGPIAFVSLKVHGITARITLRAVILGFLIQAIGVALASWILFQIKERTYRKCLLFFTLFGMTVGILGVLPNWNIWGFSTAYSCSVLFDITLGWFVIGLVLSKFCVTVGPPA